MSDRPLILIIDDELQIRRLLEILLQTNGFDTLEALNGKQGLVLAASHQPALIMLDLGLPDNSGHEVLKQLREWYTNPIIILSVQSQEEDIVKALDSGANDYLVKPFRSGELIARIRSALRTKPATGELASILEFPPLQIDLGAHIVRKDNEVVKLTVTEFKLLALLAQEAGKVLTHHYLLREIWGPGYLNQTQYLRVFIAQLRKKIEFDPNRPRFILTEPGVGYRFMT
jgi:two-component system KDP operon response regulator KdpE